LWSDYFKNGFEAKVINNDITGVIRYGRFLGINITYVIVPPRCNFVDYYDDNVDLDVPIISTVFDGFVIDYYDLKEFLN
jgi:hypothetical protein